MQQWTGRRSVAFRAGNMAASEESLRQLEAAGILIDSSYTFPMRAGSAASRAEPYNGSKWYGQVWNGPLRLPPDRLPGMHPAKPLDLMGISFEECRDAIQRICGAGADAVMILHSFSLFKVRNVQYEGGRPNRIVIRRFRRLCEWLAGRSGLQLHVWPTGRAVRPANTKRRTCHRANSPIPDFGRKAVQVWNGSTGRRVRIVVSY